LARILEHTLPVAGKHVRRTVQQLRDARRRAEQRHTDVTEKRRAEDRVRDNLHDERAVTVRRAESGVPRVPERRRGRTDAELRRDLAQLQNKWEGADGKRELPKGGKKNARR
jgi:hypothetical protein